MIVYISLSKYPTASYSFSIFFNCATANVEKLIAAALDEVKQIRDNGATTDDISKFKSEEQRQNELRLRDNGFWLNYLTNLEKYGENLDQIMNFMQRLDKVTVETSKETARKYLN